MRISLSQESAEMMGERIDAGWLGLGTGGCGLGTGVLDAGCWGLDAGCGINWMLDGWMLGERCFALFARFVALRAGMLDGWGWMSDALRSLLALLPKSHPDPSGLRAGMLDLRFAGRILQFIAFNLALRVRIVSLGK